MRKITLILSLTVSALTYVSCSDPLVPICDGSTPTYDGSIKAIIDNNCTGGLCHDNGSSKGDFTSYSGLKTVIDNGKFETEVLVNQSMPRNGNLSQEEIDAIQCWMENDYLEK